LRRVQKAEKERDLLNAELKQTRSEIAFTLGEVIESRSHETANHVRRVAAVTEYLACKMGYIEEEAGLIGLASSLHDVGKIGTPEAILNKEGKLTPEEFEIVKRHTTLGHKILSSSGGSLFDLAAVIALEHHEKWDGSGYPQGLAGNAISQEARIVAVVDVFDALANRRVYKAPWPLDRIVQTLIEERGRHFEPFVVDLFLRHLEEIIALCRVFPDHTETAPRKEPPDHESLPERILSSPHLLS
ncbi:MAG: HD domain-containing protein, partial [Synergistales bacterium]|nr:HD domain-containing protein [Synergistales bacterium]